MKKFRLYTILLCALASSCKKLGGTSAPPVPDEVLVFAPWNIMPTKIGSNPTLDIGYKYKLKIYTSTSAVAPVGVAIYNQKNGNKLVSTGFAGACNCTESSFTETMNFPAAQKYWYVSALIESLNCYWPTNISTNSNTGGNEEFEALTPIFDKPQNVTIMSNTFNTPFTTLC